MQWSLILLLEFDLSSAAFSRTALGDGSVASCRLFWKKAESLNTVSLIDGNLWRHMIFSSLGSDTCPGFCSSTNVIFSRQLSSYRCHDFAMQDLI